MSFGIKLNIGSRGKSGFVLELDLKFRLELKLEIKLERQSILVHT